MEPLDLANRGGASVPFMAGVPSASTLPMPQWREVPVGGAFLVVLGWQEATAAGISTHLLSSDLEWVILAHNQKRLLKPGLGNMKMKHSTLILFGTKWR